MGFFDSLKKKPLKVDDQQLLLEAMLCVAFADGDDQYEETNLVRAFANTLPEFKEADFDKQMADAKKLRAKFNSVQEAVKALGEISSEAVRKKAFILAADIALSSGDVDEAEEELLEAMQRVMGIDDNLANTAISILALKYAK